MPQVPDAYGLLNGSEEALGTIARLANPNVVDFLDDAEVLCCRQCPGCAVLAFLKQAPAWFYRFQRTLVEDNQPEMIPLSWLQVVVVFLKKEPKLQKLLIWKLLALWGM